ncbi:MAG TPA: hypothetical protein VG944_05050, partial [Fimbriimonas sp.]|nr:hypothetical protein [Fimbriimonas sp.]
ASRCRGIGWVFWGWGFPERVAPLWPFLVPFQARAYSPSGDVAGRLTRFAQTRRPLRATSRSVGAS